MIIFLIIVSSIFSITGFTEEHLNDEVISSDEEYHVRKWVANYKNTSSKND